MTGPDLQRLHRRACNCGAPPEVCVPNDAVLVQYAADSAEYRSKPREGHELDLSLLLGEDWTVESAATYVRRGEPPTQRILQKAGIRPTTAGKLREAGLTVVHTPGAIANGPHISVVWPNWEQPDNSWPSTVSDGFDSCFNGEEES